MTSCEKCGGRLEVRRSGSAQGLFCTQCDWSVVTTYIPAIEQDTAEYEVRLTNGDYKSEQHIKAVATVAGLNFLEARKLLKEQRDSVIFKGSAPKVMEIQNVLKPAGLSYRINPPYPW
jgi:hypothetical protein